MASSRHEGGEWKERNLKKTKPLAAKSRNIKENNDGSGGTHTSTDTEQMPDWSVAKGKLRVEMVVVFIRGPEVERLLPGPPVVAERGLACSRGRSDIFLVDLDTTTVYCLHQYYYYCLLGSILLLHAVLLLTGCSTGSRLECCIIHQHVISALIAPYTCRITASRIHQSLLLHQ